MPTHAFINHDLVRWARERRGLTAAEAAEDAGITSERWDAWESGDEHPTFRQAQLLARHLNIPFGYLFLSEPPSGRLQLPDLRTVSGRSPATPSPELSDVVDDAVRKQQWYREYLEEEGAPAVPFIGKYTEDHGDWEQIAAEIRSTFGINTQLRRQSIGWEDFLRNFVRQIEASGVLVLRNSVVGNNNYRPLDVEEFRGFAISDTLAPLIFVNSRDALSAQVFTLAHELAHLWIGSTGVSNPNYRRSFSEQSNTTENMCNYLAAEALVPGRELQNAWKQDDDTIVNLRRISALHRVSTLVVLRRAYDLMKIDHEEYRQIYAMIYGRRNRTRDTDNLNRGGDFYTSLLSKNSRAFTTSLVLALEEGRVLHTDAADLLGVHFGTLEGVYDHVTTGNIGA